MTRRLIFTFIALLIASVARASSPVSTFTVPVSVIDGYVIVDVRLNGAGPFHFMFDTAAGLAVLDSTAGQLALKATDWDDTFGDGENKVHWRRADIQGIQVGEWHASHLTTGVVAADDVDAVFGTFPLSGFIGAPLLKNMAVRLDYTHKRLTFTPANQFAYSGTGAVLPFHDGHVIAAVDGLKQPLLVDTGTNPGLIIGAFTCARFHLTSKYRPSVQGISDWGMGGPVHTRLTRAHLLEVGNIKVSDPVLRLSVQKTGALASAYGRLGSHLLSRFDITFDESRSRIIFEKNSDFDHPDAYDRSGMWIGPAGKFFKAVDVVPGGPADTAGIKPGDTILSIDGVSTTNLVLPLEREKLEHGAIGTKVTLLLKSGDRRRVALVTLRDLI